MSGYLFKRASNAFKSWSRRWFILRDNRIVYQSESKAEVRLIQQQYCSCHIEVTAPSPCTLLLGG
jgi:Arf-GAP/coiled-coil/ANK repeat/PH domain-containing protein